MPITRTMILLVALAGCREKIEYHRVEFPGFSLEVPTGLDYGKDHVTEYRAGQAQSVVGTRLVIIGWQAGANATVEEMPAMVRAITAALPKSAKLETDPPRATKVAGHDATRLDARIEQMKLSIVDIACGKRSVMVGVGTTGDVDAMRERIVASFDCHPVAAQDDAIGTTAVPFGIDDPALLAGWHLMDNDDIFTISNDVLVVAMMQVPRSGAIDSRTLNKVLPAIFGGFGASWTTDRTQSLGERAFQIGRMTADGETTPGAVTLWNCAGRADAVMALALAPGGDALTPAIDLLAKVRCPRPDDPPLPLGPAPPSGDPPAPPK